MGVKEVSLAVTQETTYSIAIHTGFEWRAWLLSGGLDPENYDDLYDVLADEAALRRLFLVHNSVDYLAGTTKAYSAIKKILRCDLAAKWISLSDYALDALYTNEAIAAEMNATKKYGYGEWVAKATTPIMTDNTTVNGVVTASSEDAGHMAYRAFDGNKETSWLPSTNSNSNYIQFEFPAAVNMTQLDYCITIKCISDNSPNINAAIIASNDESDWELLNYVIIPGTFQGAPGTYINRDTIKFMESGSYKYYRLDITGALNTSSYKIEFNLLRFCDWEPKGNVMIMTGATAPCGEVISNSVVSSTYPAWKVFDGNTDLDDRWSGGQATLAYVGYRFTNPVMVKMVDFYPRGIGSSDTCMDCTATIDASNDGVNWTTLKTLSLLSTEITQNNRVDIINNEYYMYYRFNWTSFPWKNTSNVNWCGMRNLQFYGHELKMSVPTMTSNVLPYGNAFADREHTGSGGFPAWKAFDGSRDTVWGGDTNASGFPYYIGYRFNKPECIKKVFIYSGATTDTGIRHTFKIQVLTDENTWSDLSSSITQTAQSTLVNLDNDDFYTTYRCFISSGTGYTGTLRPNIGELQFFGKNYSEKEFEAGAHKLWLYDHGVYPSVSFYSSATTEASDNGYELYLCGTGSNASNLFRSLTKIDTTGFSLYRANIGTRLWASNTRYPQYGESLGLYENTTTSTADAIQEIGNTVVNPNTAYSIDISAINKEEYVTYANGGNVGSGNYRIGTINEWWFE